MFKSKNIIFIVFFLVILSIVLTSVFDKPNNLKDEAIKFSDLNTCNKITYDFIKEDCIEIVMRKKKLLKSCESKGKDCNNLSR